MKTFGTLAFSVAEQPDKISDTKLNEVLTKAFGANASIGVTAAVRRLAFEGLTYSLQDIRIRSELDHAATRPVPTGEREDLRKTQVTKLKGILIEGELEPAFALVDKAAAMLRDGVVRYLAPSSCTSRDQELQSTKRDRDMITLEGGELSVKKKDQTQSTSIATEFLLQQAFTRRGLALDRVGILDFDVHERVIRQFFHMCTRPTPAGYDKPTAWHIVKADREMWSIISRECRTGCKPDATGARPLDSLVRDAANNHLVTVYMLPVASRGRPEFRQTESHDRPWKGKGGKGKGKDKDGRSRTQPHRKGKGKTKDHSDQPGKGRPAMPKELRQYEPFDKQGRRRCYGWNLEEGCHLSASEASTSAWPAECQITEPPAALGSPRPDYPTLPTSHQLPRAQRPLLRRLALRPCQPPPTAAASPCGPPHRASSA